MHKNNQTFVLIKLVDYFHYHTVRFSVVNKLLWCVAVADYKFDYEKVEKYYDGAKLTVGSNYSVKIRESGIVVFIGEKENYGNVVIVQQIDGIDMWYGNISDTSYSMYDYVKKGDILGVSNDYLYVVYKQNGKVLDYEKYL